EGEGIDVIALLRRRDGGRRQRVLPGADQRRGEGPVPRLPGAEAGEQVQVRTQVPARDRAGDQRPGRPAVGEEGAGLIRPDARLARHLLLAPREQAARQPHEPDAPARDNGPAKNHGADSPAPGQWGTSMTYFDRSPARNSRVPSRSNFGSVASMQRKKRDEL